MGAPLADALAPIVDRLTATGGALGVYVKDVSCGEETGLGADTRFPLASVLKVPVLVELFRQVRDGRVHLATRRETRRPYTPGSGVLHELEPGLALTLRDLATLMIIRSDNVATDMVVEVVGLPNVNATLRRLGVADVSVTMDCTALLFTIMGLDPWRRTAADFEEYRRRAQGDFTPAPDCLAFSESLENTVGSPRGLGRLFELILSGQAVDRQQCDQMLDLLRRQQINDRLPARLPPGVKVAHKTGSIRGVRNDCGIMFLDRGPVIVCCLTKGVPEVAVAVDAIAEIGKAVYDHYR